MKSLFKSISLIVFLAVISFSAMALGPNYGEYLLTNEGYYTDTCGSASTSDTTDYYFIVPQKINKTDQFNYFIVEVMQNSQNVSFVIDYPDPQDIRFRYIAADSTARCQAYGYLGWVDVPVKYPGNTDIAGSYEIPFSLRTGSAVWSVRGLHK